MTLSEYRRRFKGLPMREYRRQMSPAVFATFLKFVGCVKAPPGFDWRDLLRDQCSDGGVRVAARQNRSWPPA